MLCMIILALLAESSKQWTNFGSGQLYYPKNVYFFSLNAGQTFTTYLHLSLNDRADLYIFYVGDNINQLSNSIANSSNSIKSTDGVVTLSCYINKTSNYYIRVIPMFFSGAEMSFQLNFSISQNGIIVSQYYSADYPYFINFDPISVSKNSVSVSFQLAHPKLKVDFTQPSFFSNTMITLYDIDNPNNVYQNISTSDSGGSFQVELPVNQSHSIHLRLIFTPLVGYYLTSIQQFTYTTYVEDSSTNNSNNTPNSDIISSNNPNLALILPLVIVGACVITIIICLCVRKKCKKQQKPINQNAYISSANLMTSTQLQLKECVICLDPNCDTILSCQHPFHKKCINKWISKNQFCPICRKKIIVLGNK